MTLTNWKGITPQHVLHRNIDDFLSDKYREMINWGKMRDDDISVPAANVKEEDKTYFLEIAAPGYKKEDFNITVDDNVLTVRTERKVKKKDDDRDKYMHREFHYNGFTRSFTLPEYVEEEYITAKFEDGILKIDIPRQRIPASNDEPRKVIIQ